MILLVVSSDLVSIFTKNSAVANGGIHCNFIGLLFKYRHGDVRSFPRPNAKTNPTAYARAYPDTETNPRPNPFPVARSHARSNPTSHTGPNAKTHTRTHSCPHTKYHLHVNHLDNFDHLNHLDYLDYRDHHDSHYLYKHDGSNI